MGISVPTGAMRKFFRLIATARLERGEYVSYFSHTDDFPSIQQHRRRLARMRVRAPLIHAKAGEGSDDGLRERSDFSLL
jgi:hypothetical protein